MIVRCQVQNCGYNNNGSCSRMLVVSMNAMGMCSWMYFPNGQIKQGFENKPEEKPWWQIEEEMSENGIPSIDTDG